MTGWGPLRGGANQFAFVIEADDRIVLGATDRGAVAYAMYRAALEEHSGRRVVLRLSGEVLAPRAEP